MGHRWRVSRRQFLQTLAASGAITGAGLASSVGPFVWTRKAHAASTVRFQFSVPEPLRISLVEGLVDRFNKSQSDVEVKVEFVPQAQARQQLITAITAGNPPDCCQMWDNWLGEFDGMGALEDLTERMKAWKYYATTVPTAWQTVSLKGKIVSFPLALTNDAIFIRTDRVKEYGLKMPTFDWTTDDFLTLAKGFTKPEKNQYGFGLRGGGTWAVLYATEFMYGNGAQVLKDGKVVINSPEAVSAFEWYIDLIRKWKVTPPSAPTDAYRQIVEGFGRGVTSMYLHNSGSIEEQKKFVGEPNFATLPIPVGPAKKRASFFFSETLTMFKGGQEQGGGLEVPDLDDGRRAALPVLQDPRPAAHAAEPGRKTAVHGGRLCGLRQVHPLLHRQPVPGLPGVGRQAGFGRGAHVPAGVRRPDHAEAVLWTSLPRC